MQMAGRFYDQSAVGVVVDPTKQPTPELQQSLTVEMRKYDALEHLDARYRDLMCGAAVQNMDAAWIVRNKTATLMSERDIQRFENNAWSDFVGRRFTQAGSSEALGKTMLDIVRSMKLQMQNFVVWGFHPKVEAVETQVVQQLQQKGFLPLGDIRTVAIQLRRSDAFYAQFAIAVGSQLVCNNGHAIGAGGTKYNRDLQYAYRDVSMQGLTTDLHKASATLEATLKAIDSTDYVQRLSTLRLVVPRNAIHIPEAVPAQSGGNIVSLSTTTGGGQVVDLTPVLNDVATLSGVVHTNETNRATAQLATDGLINQITADVATNEQARADAQAVTVGLIGQITADVATNEQARADAQVVTVGLIGQITADAATNEAARVTAHNATNMAIGALSGTVHTNETNRQQDSAAINRIVNGIATSIATNEGIRVTDRDATDAKIDALTLIVQRNETQRLADLGATNAAIAALGALPAMPALAPGMIGALMGKMDTDKAEIITAIAAVADMRGTVRLLGDQLVALTDRMDAKFTEPFHDLDRKITAMNAGMLSIIESMTDRPVDNPLLYSAAGREHGDGTLPRPPLPPGLRNPVYGRDDAHRATDASAAVTFPPGSDPVQGSIAAANFLAQ